jgi:Domain of unknown function (DUF4345)
MPHPFSMIYLAVTAIFFAGSGVYALSKPLSFAAALDLSTLRAGGVNEVRAQYGGFFLVLGVTCALAMLGIVDRRFGLGAAAITLGGVAGGRWLGLIVDRGVVGYGAGIRSLFLVDSAGCALAVAALMFDA